MSTIRNLAIRYSILKAIVGMFVVDKQYTEIIIIYTVLFCVFSQEERAGPDEECLIKVGLRLVYTTYNYNHSHGAQIKC